MKSGTKIEKRFLGLGLSVLALAAGLACSPKRYATDKVADMLASPGGTTGSDEDPDLIRDAAPFSLKLMESVLHQTPSHRGLLTALCSQFTQYAYVFVQMPADEAEEADLAAALRGRERARKLFLRAKAYGIRGLETSHPDFARALAADPGAAAATCVREDVPLLYWTTMAWGGAISLSKTRPDTVAEIPQMEALATRALTLDDTYAAGALHTFFVTYEGQRPGSADAAAAAAAKTHFERAVTLSAGKLASPYVAFAEGWAVRAQDREAFRDLLKKALAVDPDALPESRLENLLMQRRARWLLSREEALFAE